MNNFPTPAISRLCALYQLLGQIKLQNSVSSAELGKLLGVAAHSIRKDISFLGVAGNSGAGYDVSKLRSLIADSLGLAAVRRVCVVGLGRMGSAILNYPLGEEFKLVAGFDSSINRLETIRTSVELFPAYRISEVVRSLSIDLAIITVPAESAQEVAERLVEGGVKGIVNFAPAPVKSKDKGVFVKQIDIDGELSILSARISVSTAL